MLALKYMLTAAAALFVIAASIAFTDLRVASASRRQSRVTGWSGETPGGGQRLLCWRTSVALVLMAWMPLLIALGVAVVHSGEPGVRQRSLPPVTKSAGKLSGRNQWMMVLPGNKFFCAGYAFQPTMADTGNPVRQEMHPEEQK
jgi:hypothetical protein